jgi:hypothetical protein
VSTRTIPPTGGRIRGKNTIQKGSSRARVRSWTVDDALTWEQEFLGRCSMDLVAYRAWGKIVEGGLANVSKRLLWEYSLMSDEVVTELKRDMDKMRDTIVALGRAVQVASDRSDGPRPDMFDRRVNAKARTAGQSPWAFRNPDVETFADAAVNYPDIGRLPIGAAAGMMSKSGDAIRRYGDKILIAMLQAGTQGFSVSLTPNELAALATCAKPDCNLDGRSLRRFLKLPAIVAAEGAYRTRFAKGRAGIAPLSV